MNKQKVYCDMDMMDGHPATKDAVPMELTEFVHKGMAVTEIRFCGWRPGITRLGWVRTPWDKAIVDDKSSPIVYFDLPADALPSVEGMFRGMVRQAFERHYHLDTEPT